MSVITQFIPLYLLVPLILFALLVILLVIIGKVPISYNVRNLIVRWRITLLTALAFTLVVGLMTAMLGFVNGMYRLTENSGQPSNVIVLADGATDELFSNLGFGDITQIELHPGVARDDQGKPLASWEVYVVVNQPIPNLPPDAVRQRRFIQVRGMMDAPRSGVVHNMPLHEGGKWFSSEGVEKLKDSAKGEEIAVQAVIGEGLARELGKDYGKPALLVGDTFDLGPRKWKVVGILQSSGATFDSEVWAKRQIVGEMFGKNSYTTVVLRCTDPGAAQETAKDLSANYKRPAVQAITEPEYYEKLNTTNEQFLYSVLVVVTIMAIGGVFGIMNTMFAAISQRIKDIGVLRILGFARWQVLVSFFLEALVLALVGGAIGCLLGYLLANGWTATSTIGANQGGGKSIVFKLVVDGKIILGGLVFSLIMGCIGGLVPAWSAMRLRPLESVR
jgi:ABC-type antimicrobial peptide transport system permease subunit